MLIRRWALTVLVAVAACSPGIVSADSQAPNLVSQRDVFYEIVDRFDGANVPVQVGTGIEAVGDCGSFTPGDGITVWMQVALRPMEPMDEVEFRSRVDAALGGTDRGDTYVLDAAMATGEFARLNYSVDSWDNGYARWALMSWGTDCFSRESISDVTSVPADWFATDEAFRIQARRDVNNISNQIGDR